MTFRSTLLPGKETRYILVRLCASDSGSKIRKFPYWEWNPGLPVRRLGRYLQRSYDPVHGTGDSHSNVLSKALVTTMTQFWIWVQYL